MAVVVEEDEVVDDPPEVLPVDFAPDDVPLLLLPDAVVVAALLPLEVAAALLASVVVEPSSVAVGAFAFDELASDVAAAAEIESVGFAEVASVLPNVTAAKVSVAVMVLSDELPLFLAANCTNHWFPPVYLDSQSPIPDCPTSPAKTMLPIEMRRGGR